MTRTLAIIKFVVALVIARFSRRSSMPQLPSPRNTKRLNPLFVERLYRRGFRAADLAPSMPGIVIVSPVKPPAKTDGGLFIPGSVIEMPGTMTMVHQVEAVGPGVTRFRPGDVVVCRLSHLDPLDAQTGILAIEEKHIYSPVEDSLDTGS